MDRTTFTFSQMLNTLGAILTAFLLFAGAVHVANHGVASRAIASSEGLFLGDSVERSNGAGLVLFVSLQRG